MPIASVQMEVTDELKVNLERILRGIKEGQAKGARVVVFPETALSGFREEAIQKPGWAAIEEAQKQIADEAARHKLYVIYGCATNSGQEKPFNSAIVVGPDGAEVTRYHKMFPESYFEPGTHLSLFEIDGVR